MVFAPLPCVAKVHVAVRTVGDAGFTRCSERGGEIVTRVASTTEFGSRCGCQRTDRSKSSRRFSSGSHPLSNTFETSLPVEPDRGEKDTGNQRRPSVIGVHAVPVDRGWVVGREQPFERGLHVDQHAACCRSGDLLHNHAVPVHRRDRAREAQANPLTASGAEQCGGEKIRLPAGRFGGIQPANQTTKSEILVDNGKIRKIPSLLQLVPMEAENEEKRFFQKGWNRISNFDFSSSSCSGPDPTRIGGFPAETRRATRQPFRHPAAGHI